MTFQLIHSNGARFDVLGSAEDGKVWLRRVGGIVADGMRFERDYLDLHFTAYPPQPEPDRVDRLAEEAANAEPVYAIRVTYCSNGHGQRHCAPGRVVEAYGGCLVDAEICVECGTAYDPETLATITIWKD